MTPLPPNAILKLPDGNSPTSEAVAGVNSALLAARRELASLWLKLPAGEVPAKYEGQFGQLQRLLLNSDLRSAPLEARDQELVAVALKGLQDADPARPEVGTFLAAMLFLEPHELPQIIDFARLPGWLLDDYAGYMMTPMHLFRYPGEAEAYGRHMQRWVDYLHAGILGNPTNELWKRIGSLVELKLNLIAIYFNELNLRELYRKRAQIFEFVLATSGHWVDWVPPARPARPKIRVGVLAAYFVPTTETFATLPVYEHLDRSRFEIVLFACQVGNTALERHCMSRADHFVQLPEGMQNQVNTIRQTDLDMILVATNVTALTNAVTRLAIHRLARVQVALVPSCTTSGMRHMDCYLSGRLSEPAEKAQEHYTERLFMVDGPAHCYDFATEKLPPPTQLPTRETLGIPAEAVVFISGANFYKLIPEVQDVWMRILAATPGSRLILYPFNPNWSDKYPVAKFLTRFKAAAREHQIAEERIIVLAPAPNRADVLARLKLADIYLDSFPFSGATSLLDPFEAGLPSVAMDGTSFRALVGPALLRTMGLEELIAANPQDYIEIACRLATDSQRRGRLRDQTEAAMRAVPKFLDARWYGGEVTKVLTAMWNEKSVGLSRAF
ncbi:MAG: hypothetical protein WCF18_02905 [Chthoniobacteraceae bacterium]